MPDMILHNKGIAGKAKQDFFFTSFNEMIGGTFSLKRKSKK